MRSPRKSAISHLQREMPQWIAMADKELSEPTTREVGRLRMLLIKECLKLLGLMKRQLESGTDTRGFRSHL